MNKKCLECKYQIPVEEISPRKLPYCKKRIRMDIPGNCARFKLKKKRGSK